MLPRGYGVAPGPCVGVQLVELRVPARDRGPQLVGLGRQAQEAVALAELEVLVAAADDPGPLEARDRERQAAERVVGVDEQLGARVRTRLRQRRQLGDDARVLEEHGRDEHRARARSLGGEPLGERLHRPGREPDDLEPLLRPAARAGAAACGTRRRS